MAKKPTDSVREFAERYEKRIAELESKLEAEAQHAREGWGLAMEYHGRIAELEAERTCRNIAEPDEMSDEPFTCSECGARGLYGEGIYHIGGCKEIDGKTVFWDAWPVYKYCPNCGRKVMP